VRFLSAALRPRSIRFSLVALVLACVLPLIALAAVLVHRQTASHEAQLRSQMLTQVRTLALAIERELGTARTALGLLASANALESRDFTAFHALASTAANGLGSGAYITLVEGESQLVSTALPPGPALPIVGGPAIEAARTTLPVVSNLFTGFHSRLVLVGVAVPVRTANGYYGLAAHLPPDRFSAILRAQGLPDRWQSGVIDGTGLVVARSNERQRHVGERGNEALIEARGHRSEGLFETVSRRDEPMLGAFANIAGSDWTVRVSAPHALVTGTPLAALGWLAIGGCLLLGASLVGAGLMAKRIVRPIRALESLAAGVGDTGPLVPGAAGTLRETASVANALVAAHEGLREAEASRAQALAAEAARTKAETASRAKSDFLAQISHEVRTPLSGVIGLADVLMLEPLAAPTRARVGVLRSTAASLQKMLDDLLAMATLDAGRVTVDAVAFDPATLAAEVAELFRPAAAAKGVEIVVSTRVPYRVLGDPTRVREVLSNVMGNAVKFTPAGRITLSMSMLESGRRLLVEVADTGIGIEPDALERVFEPFTQATPDIARRYGGTGLGLAISRRLVAAMGGTIRARRSEPAGSVISFDVQVGPAEGESGAIAARPLRSPRPLRILSAEDNAVIRDTQAAMLARLGHAVTSVSNGRLALDALAHGVFDLVLLDLRMPEMDGWQTLAALRRLPGGTALPVIAISAAIGELPARDDGVRFDAVFAKPVDWDELQDTMARLTERRLSTGTRPAQPAAIGATEPKPLPTLAAATAAAHAMDRPLGDLLDAFRTLLSEGEAQTARADDAAVRETVHTIAGIAGIFGCVEVSSTVQATRDLPSTVRFERIAGAVRRTLAELESSVARPAG
jgi:signal transduction histidine kinase/ActR/RegA family two-component response regulator/HPt (histidine-containing phosphotransfer) domain-containing protein